MARFALNQPIETDAPSIVVDAGMPVGQHRFQLVVIDDAGNKSKAATAVVDIQRTIISPDILVRPPGVIIRRPP